MELKVLLSALRRGLLFLLAALSVGAALGAVAASLQPPRYAATATIVIDTAAVTAPGQQPFTGDPERYVEAELRVLGSAALAQRAARAVPSSTPEEVRDALSVDQVTGSNVVEVTVTDDDPRWAAAAANGVAGSYVASRQEAAGLALTQQQEAAAGRVAALEQELAATPPTNPRRDLLLTQYQQQLSRQAELDQPGVVRDDTRVVDPAEVPTRAGGISLPVAALAGALLTAALVLALLVLREVRRPHLAGRPHVELVLGRPVPLAFPRGVARGGEVRERGLEPARRLTALMRADAFQVAPPPRTVLVTSPARGAGTTTVASLLAVALAEQGKEVRLVQLDGEEPAPLLAGGEPLVRPVAAKDRAVAGRGLGEAAPAPVATVLQSVPSRVEGASLLVLGADEAPPRGEQLRVLLAGTAGAPDVVVVDGPSVLESDLAADLAQWADQVVLVVDLPSTTERELAIADEVLGLHGADRLHPVLNRSAR